MTIDWQQAKSTQSSQCCAYECRTSDNAGQVMSLAVLRLCLLIGSRPSVSVAVPMTICDVDQVSVLLRLCLLIGSRPSVSVAAPLPIDWQQAKCQCCAYGH
jgi:hypothetical protein